MAVQLVEPSAPSGVERLVDDYLNHCAARGLAPRTVDKTYGYALNAVFLPWCASQGIRDVSDLDSRALDRFTTALLSRQRHDGKPLSRYSVHAYVRPVRQMLTWAASIGEDIKGKPQLPRRSKPHHDILTRDEIDQLERAAGSERDRLIIRILADCGLRLSELTGLREQDIVRSGRQAHLRVLGKLSRVRDVPIAPPLLRRLERYVSYLPEGRSDGRVFVASRRGRDGEYNALATNGVYQAIRDAQARAGMTKRVHPHLFRHSWMTEMLRKGMNPIQLSVIAGASMGVIAEHYTHLTRDDAYDAMLRLFSSSDS